MIFVLFVGQNWNFLTDMINNQAHAEKQAEVEADQALIPLLEELVAGIHKMASVSLCVRNGVYSFINTDNMVKSFHYDGCEIGYHLEPGKTMLGEFTVRFEQPIKTIPDEQKDPIIAAVIDTCGMEGQGMTAIQTFKHGQFNTRRGTGDEHDCFLIAQSFSPLALTMTPTAKGHIKINDDLDKILH